MERLLSKKDVRTLIGLSYAQIDRMEFDHAYRHLEFPNRVRIGFRVFWVESEISEWIDWQIRLRDAPKL